jgi:hypothetical protein
MPVKRETNMRSKRNLLITGAVFVICLIAAQLAISVTGNHRNNDYETVITTPEYQTDTTRAINAYERLMERYMDLSESYLIDSRSVAQKLDSIEAKMDDVSARFARIEKAMGIDPNGNIAPKSAKTSSTK